MYDKTGYKKLTKREDNERIIQYLLDKGADLNYVSEIVKYTVEQLKKMFSNIKF